MLTKRFSFAFVFLAATLLSPPRIVCAQETQGKNRGAGALSSIVGLWKVEAERTNRANADSRQSMSPETIEQLNSMTLMLNADGKFEQAIEPSHKITGTWSFDVDEPNEASSKVTRRLTLAPDNLEGHAEMHFDIVFIRPDLIEARPPQGTGTVYFAKQGSRATRNTEAATQGRQADQGGDKAAEMFADVPGCLGARSMDKNGVQISFVWFEDRNAIVSWCKSRKHAGTATRMMQLADPEIRMREPLGSAPDEQGPFLVIMTLKPKEDRSDGFPLEQLSMEIYKPVDGGMFIGGRFAPKGLDVDGLREILPK